MNFHSLEKGLTGEYKEAYKKVSTYAAMKNYSGDSIEEQMTELYDILLTAEKNGKPVQSIIGKDTESFLHSFFSEYGAKERVMNSLTIIYRLAVLMLIFAAFDVFAADSPKEMLLNGSIAPQNIIGGFLTGFAFTILTSTVFAPRAAKSRKNDSNKWLGLTVVVFGVLLVAEVLLMKHFKDKLGFLSVSCLPYMICCAAYITVFLVCRAVYRYRTYGTVRNVTKQLYSDAHYKSIDDAEMKYMTMKRWQKTFDKMLRKGKTEEDFEKAVRNEIKNQKTGNVIFVVTTVSLTLISIIKVAMESALTDTILYAVIITVIEGLLIRFFLRTFKSGEKTTREIIDECESEGVSMSQFIKNKLDTTRESEETDAEHAAI